MLIIPAIDIIEGKCVRLTQGRFDAKKVYDADPVKIAREFEEGGADMIHIIDLEGAKAREPRNADLIIKIRQSVSIPVEVGGGIRDMETAGKYLNAGIDRVIIGTKAIQSPEFLQELVSRFGAERIVAGIDAKNGKVAIEAWEETSDMDAMDFARQMKDIGITEIIFTDIARDGMLGEPNYKPLSALRELGVNVIASGGVSDVPTVRKLAGMGVYGAIIGKAIYEKKITVREAAQARDGAQSGLAKRIIPCMDIAEGRVVKGVHFKNLKDAGDPVALGKHYSDQGADELVFLDIMATVENRPTFYKLVENIAKNINIPFTVGGGIRTLDNISALLKSGADKVSIGSLAIQNPEFVRQAAEQFGSQCIVISIDPKLTNGKWSVFIKGGREDTGVDAIEFAGKMEEYGAGELLVNSLDRDGTKEGYDIPLLKAISDAVNLPVIASSGAGKKEDFLEAFVSGGCDAALAASLFHYGTLTVPEVKKYLISHNIPIRP